MYKGAVIRERRPPKSGQNRKLLYLLDKKICEELTRQGVWDGVGIGKKVTKKTRVSLTIFVDTAFSAPDSLSLIRMTSSWYREGKFHMGVYDLLIERRMRVAGRSE